MPKHGLAGGLMTFLERNNRAVAAVLIGATAFPAIVGTPTTAWAHPDETSEGTTTHTLRPPELRAPRLSPPRLSRDELRIEPEGPSRAHDEVPTGERLMVRLPDGRRINALATPSEVLSAAIQFPAPPPERVERSQPVSILETELAGVPSAAFAQPWTASFEDYFRARAALGEVPTTLAGMFLQPIAEGGYRVVDLIPAPIRRPFDRAFGMLLENAVSAPSALMTSTPWVSSGVLPTAVDLEIPVNPQIRNSCGETAVGTWLKAHGVPIALGEVDAQTPVVEGASFLIDDEFRNRGFSVVSGPGSLADIETYVAHGYPVMVSVGWPSGGGHYAVVRGYDRRTNEFIIDGYSASGAVNRVAYGRFAEDWARHRNLMTVVHPARDERLAAYRQQHRISREARIQDGLSLSEIWVNQRFEMFVETAYRYRGANDDLTVRLNVNTAERAEGLSGMIGGSVRYTHRFGPRQNVTVYAERLTFSIRDDSRDFESVARSIAVYVGARVGAVSGRAGYERGAMQAEIQATVNRRIANFGFEARVSMGPDDRIFVYMGLSGQM